MPGHYFSMYTDAGLWNLGISLRRGSKFLAYLPIFLASYMPICQLTGALDGCAKSQWHILICHFIAMSCPWGFGLLSYFIQHLIRVKFRHISKNRHFFAAFEYNIFHVEVADACYSVPDRLSFKNWYCISNTNLHMFCLLDEVVINQWRWPHYSQSIV